MCPSIRTKSSTTSTYRRSDGCACCSTTQAALTDCGVLPLRPKCFRAGPMPWFPVRDKFLPTILVAYFIQFSQERVGTTPRRFRIQVST